jgi:hypothetical protein
VSLRESGSWLLGLLDFKVLLLEKPGGAPKAGLTENKGYHRPITILDLLTTSGYFGASLTT